MLGLRCIHRRIFATHNRSIQSRVQAPRAFYSNLSRTLPAFAKHLPSKPYSATIINYAARRWNSTTSAPPSEESGDVGSISSEELADLKAQASEQWPPMLAPTALPNGWSQDFANWEYLPTLFWFSPYIYNIPQIDLLTGVLFNIRQSLRPIMYKQGSDADGIFIFRLVEEHSNEEPTEWFLCNPSLMELSTFPAPSMDVGITDVSSLTLTEYPMHPPGLSVLQRILEGDETVGEALREFLPTMPTGPEGPTAREILEQAQNQTDLPPEFLAQIQSLKDAEDQISNKGASADASQQNDDSAIQEADIEELEKAVERASESLARWDEVDSKLDEVMKASKDQQK